MPRLTTAVLLLSLLAAPAGARDWFVNNLAGDNAFDGARATADQTGGPVRTIARALELACPGDRVVITKTSEPYHEQIAIAGPRLHGTPTRPLVIESDGAVLDGSVRACGGAWRHVAGEVFAARPRRLAYQQLFASGAPLTRVRLASAADAQHALAPRAWALAGGEILFRADKDRLPESYDLRHAGLQTGVTLYNTRHVIVRGLVIQGFQQDGVNAHDLVSDCAVESCELRANGRSGASAGGASRLAVRASSLYDNGATQARVEGFARLTIDACDIESPEGAAKFDQRGGDLLVDGEPAAPAAGGQPR